MDEQAEPTTAAGDPPDAPAATSAGHRAEPGVLPRLLAAAAAGDQKAWDDLVVRFTPLLWSVARSFRLDRADAGDVVQNTWLRLVEHLGSIHDPERLGAWLATTTRNEALRMLRTGKREVVGENDEAMDRIPDAGDPLESRLLLDERDKALWEAFDTVDDRCRQLLRVLMTSPPPAYSDVSAALDMPVGSIGPTRARCLEKVRVALAGSGVLDDQKYRPPGTSRSDTGTRRP